MICQVHLSQRTPARAVILSQSIMDEYGFADRQSVHVEIGRKSMIASTISHPLSGNHIILSKTIAQSLLLPHTGSIRVTFHQKKLKLGPVIGIFTTGFTGDALRPFGGRTRLFQSFLQAGAEEKPYYYVFTPEMIDWQQKMVTGWYYRNHTWVPIRSPFPDVVYERIPNRKIESSLRVQSCLTRLKEQHQVTVFNQGFFDKWSIHQWLNRHPKTERYIPETYQSPSISTLSTMLKKHKMVYLKPSKGSLGLGIYRITVHPRLGYYCRFHQGDSNVLHRYQSLDKLIQAYFGFGKRGIHHYLAQQGIRLIRFHNRPVDFRIHMHKDQNNQWEIVGIGAKAAGTGSVTTHIRTGGSIISTTELLKQTFGNNASSVKQTLEQAAIDIAQALEGYTDGPLGELGLDMGIDTDHRTWLFEVNAKPGRHIFQHPSLRQAGRQSAKYITSYSLALSHFE